MRHLVPLARRALHSAQRLVPPARRGAAVLAYHLVDGGTDVAVDQPLALFRAQLEQLQRHHRVVPLLEADPSGPPDQVVLTFDDAYANFYDVVWPVLRELDLPATLYVPVAFVDGGATPMRGHTLAPCTWAQLREMASQGLDIGSHTRSHPDLRRLHGDALDAEIRGSRQDLEDRLGVAVRTFCYPRGLHSAAARAAVAEAYALGVVGRGGRYHRRSPPEAVPRFPLRRDHGVGAFAEMLRGRVWLEERLADRVRQRMP